MGHLVDENGIKSYEDIYISMKRLIEKVESWNGSG
jgi:hypothetical protein